jgi:TFIIF-interacting CTD phosphatase-like protein
MKNLFILDLDHTLIYGSYAEQESAPLLFLYNTYLKVYKRPLAEQLIEICKINGDIIIYTTALRPYANRISKKLNIQPIQILSRKQCLFKNGSWGKIVNDEWINKYDKIIIIDDSPNVWLDISSTTELLIPTEFRGSENDFGLEEIITKLSRYQ